MQEFESPERLLLKAHLWKGLTFSAWRWLTKGMRVSGSVDMAHSSMIICLTLSCSREGADAAEHVHRMTSCRFSSYARAVDNRILYLVVDAQDTRLMHKEHT